MGNLRQLVQGNAFTVIFIDISFCSGTFLALGGRRGETQRNRRHTHDLDKQHLGQVLADHLAAVLPRVDFPQQQLHQTQQLLPLGAAFQHRVAVVLLVKQNFNALDAQHNIFQRVCLVAGLPDLSLEDGKLNYTVANFKSEIYSELSEKDRKLIDLFYLKFDNANLLKLLKDKEATTDFEGNYSQNELLALISSVREGDAPDKRYPSYLYEFITAYLALSAEELYRAEDMLSACYYAYAMNCGNQFVSSWFEFNLNINNILAALAARKYKMDVSQVVVGKTDVSEMIRTSNARDFGLSEMLEYFEQVLRISEIEELVEREKKIDLLKWNWMEDAVFFNYFTVERIFVFLLKLEMIGRWISMDKEKGSELFRQIIDKLKDEIQIPAEFR